MDNNPSLLQPEEHVLSTLEADGSRRWLQPKLSKGRFLNRRRWTAYGLIAAFTAIPYININGKPAILLDVMHREFYILGGSFRATDTLTLALFMLMVFLGIFAVTAMLGRVWCGWACPQTVYMEYIFRPIERLFDGRKGVGGKPAKPPAAWRTGAKYLCYFIICLHLSHIFLAYFVGVEQLFAWSLGSPFKHPLAFATILFITAAMMFDFCLFREQLCIVACPYGRLQSVLIDKSSMIISYDPGRGEPRGKLGRKKREALADKNKPEGDRVVSLEIMQGFGGDCIDCHECVTTCPTGIDIRDGIQLECIGCAQCIDACDTIMNRVGRPKGLIRYTSQEALAGEGRHILRPRVFVYPLLIAVIFSLFLFVLISKAPADVTVLRNVSGRVFTSLESGDIQNTFRLKIVNRDTQARDYNVRVVGPAGVMVVLPEGQMAIEPGASRTRPLHVITPFDLFESGELDIEIEVINEAGLSIRRQVKLSGPYQRAVIEPQVPDAPGNQDTPESENNHD